MHEQELRQHRCCFTGHRPEKLNISEEQLCVRLGLEIDRAIEDGFTTFISGMAKGVDICAAELVLKRRVSNDRLKLICALPYLHSVYTIIIVKRMLIEHILNNCRKNNVLAGSAENPFESVIGSIPNSV